MAEVEVIPRLFPQRYCNASGCHNLWKKGNKPDVMLNYRHMDDSAPGAGGFCWRTEGASIPEWVGGFSVNRGGHEDRVHPLHLELSYGNQTQKFSERKIWVGQSLVLGKMQEPSHSNGKFL